MSESQQLVQWSLEWADSSCRSMRRKLGGVPAGTPREVGSGAGPVAVACGGGGDGSWGRAEASIATALIERMVKIMVLSRLLYVDDAAWLSVVGGKHTIKSEVGR